MSQSNDYRPDIDGLRAIAVLLVVFYHAGFALFPGGFIGVDIFFVLSGYLITGIVDREVQSGSFQLTHFYTRRIKRIMPAFYFMVFVCGLAGYVWLLPPELLELAKSTLAGIFFVSNFYFGEVTEGYFAPGVDTLPLLHAWSLSVEEQFYFVWPFSLLLFRRHLTVRRIGMLLIGLLLISFVAAEIAVRSLSDVAYYALWSRAGELLVGAYLAIHRGRSRTSKDPLENHNPRVWLEASATFVGFALIFGPAFTLDAKSVFPGLNALWPCLGIALLIHLGRHPGALSHRLLHFPPMVFVGLISYALYLWHWPVFVFARTLRLEETPANRWALIALSLLLATLSWLLVERPIRYQRAISFRLAFFGIFAAPAIGFALIAFYVIETGGLRNRFSSEIQTTVQIAEAGPAEARGICHKLDEIRLPPKEPCLLGARMHANGTPIDEPDALLWGDSIANHFAGFFDEIGNASGFQLRDITMGGCPPLLGTVRLERRKGPLCRRRNDEVLEFIERSKIETVYIAGYWTSHFEPDGFLGDDVDMSRSAENSARVVRDAFERTISAVREAGKHLVIVRNVPELDSGGPSCELKNQIHPAWARRECRLPIDKFHAKTASVDALFSELLVRHPDLEILEVSDLLCTDGFCETMLDDIPLYKWGDRSHLNMAGSRALGRAYLERHGRL